MIGMIAAVIEAAVILWLLLDRRHMIRALSERRRDIRILKRMLKSERMKKMRLIDADELLNTPIRVTGKIPLKNGRVQPIEAITIKQIESAPTIDPESLRPHGEWLEGKVLEKCSICGKKGFPSWHYCPNCGAIMDLKEEESK